MIKGLPVGISKLVICLLSKLNKFLHKALIEFPWAEIRIFLSFNFSFISSSKYLILYYKYPLKTQYLELIL